MVGYRTRTSLDWICAVSNGTVRLLVNWEFVVEARLLEAPAAVDNLARQAYLDGARIVEDISDHVPIAEDELPEAVMELFSVGLQRREDAIWLLRYLKLHCDVPPRQA